MLRGTKCVKCGGSVAEVCYQGLGRKETFDKLAHTCQSCGYVWYVECNDNNHNQSTILPKLELPPYLKKGKK